VENKFLKQSIDIVPVGLKEDKNAPYSFLEWKKRRPVLDEKNDNVLYSRYILDWFKDKGDLVNQSQIVLRQKYILLLNQLQVFFTDEEKNNWYGKLNLLDDKELLLSIPFFAKKLRDISLYYLKLRKKVKQSKQKYVRVGTIESLETELRSQILDLLSDNTDKGYFSLTNKFSSVAENIVVKVEEVYDNKVYFDKSDTLPTSAYYDLFDEATAAFFASKGIVLSSDSWIFDTFNLTVTSDIQSIVDDLTNGYFEATDSDLYKSYIENFLAENKYTTKTNFVSTRQVVYELAINEGNNNFFYPYGPTETTSELKEIIQPIALSSLVIEGATAGTTLETADTMYVRVGNEIRAAWLHFKEFEDYTITLNSVIEKNSTTSFVFPYPGYGVSNNDVEWSGPSFETTQEYKFLSKEFKSKTDSFYWENDYSLNNCESLLLNNTELVIDGATPSKNPNLADQIFLRPPGSNNENSISRDTQGAWLFEFNKTSIPILNSGDNVIIWPYGTINTEDVLENGTVFEKLKYNDVCDEISLQELDIPFGVAGNSIEFSDKIFKLQKYNDPIEKAIECAWLSGKESIREKTKFIDSNTFNALMDTGEFTKFVWNGPDVLINKVFKGVPHDKDCPFSLGKADNSTPDACTCKQVYYSPFGHPGRTFLNRASFADCVIEDTGDAPSDFDFSSWRSSEGKTINEKFPIYEFAWYQTNKAEGWGDGKWVTGPVPTNSEFYLKKGKVYYYRRVNSRLFNATYPPYVVFYKHELAATKPVWIEAKRQEGGEWTSTGEISKMEIWPGDILKYDKQTNTLFEYLSTRQVPTNIQTTNKNAWIATDIVPVSTRVNVFFPTYIKDFDQIDPQYPSFTVTSISAVQYWEVQLLNNPDYPDVDRIYNKTLTLTFTPTVTGVYKISLTTINRDKRQLTLSNIPLLSVLPPTTTETLTVVRTTPRSSFVIEQNLTGWSYNKKRRFPTLPGAKPYWAVLYTGKDPANKFKGIQTWGYNNTFADGYLPIDTPLVSPIEILYQNIITYKRKGEAFNWRQNIKFREGVYTTQWCELTNSISNSSNIATFFSTQDRPQVVAIASDTPSPILLSNDIEGKTPEIDYYAINPFIWSISATVEIPTVTETEENALYEATNPTRNFFNRFYPTIANVPTLEQTFVQNEVGGYFLPQSLGASVLINKDFIVSEKSQDQQLKEETNIHVGGLGLTKQKQPTNYTWKENNEWVMEPAVAGQLAGAPKKKLTKTLQTFVPYQANSEECPLGLVHPKSRYSPWGGANNDEWTDKLNEPKSFTGVRNVSAWADSQILKQVDIPLECWVDDIHGNQYGLFKNTDGSRPSDRREIAGELWVRTNQQRVLKGSEALSAVFSPFVNTSIFADLTGKGIKNVDCLFDTLIIETSGAIIFAELLYDYDTGIIDCVYDDTRTQILTAGVYRYENSWLFGPEKKAVSLMTTITGNAFVPSLWELETDTKKTSFIFPTSAEKLDIISALSGLSAQNISRGVLSFDEMTKKYLATYSGFTIQNKPFVVNFYIKNTGVKHTTEQIEIYQDTTDQILIKEPPAVLSPYLTAIPITANNVFSITVSAANEPSYYTLINYTTSVTVNNVGTFTGTLTAGVHHVNYVVGNQIGETYYSLTLVAT
jgi:hypothetical protein